MEKIDRKSEKWRDVGATSLTAMGLSGGRQAPYGGPSMLSLQSPKKPRDPQVPPREPRKGPPRRPADLEFEGRPEPTYFVVSIYIILYKTGIRQEGINYLPF